MSKFINKMPTSHSMRTNPSRPRRLLGCAALAVAFLLHAGTSLAAGQEEEEKMVAPQPMPGQPYPEQHPPAQPGVVTPGYAAPTYIAPGTPVIIDPSSGQTRPAQPGEAPYGPFIPGVPSPTPAIPVPSVPSVPGVVPGQITPEKGGPGVIAPVIPVQPSAPGKQMIPIQPGKVAPTVITPTIPAPVKPVEPKVVEPKIIAPVKPVQPGSPSPGKRAQEKGDPGPLSPAQFLPTTTIPGEGKATPAAEKQPEGKHPKGKDQPKIKEPAKPRDPKAPKVEQPKGAPPMGEPPKGVPPKGEPPKKGPREKEPPKETAKSDKPRRGDPLRIPPEAVRTGKLDFLEGCWRGTRPEYVTKRIITERFCFDANGRGKRHIIDSAYAGECFGATQGKLDSSGKLVVTSEMGYCSAGEQWAPAEMECRGEGQETPCYWKFTGPLGGGSQSYKIPFVRE